jgi:hypothetical protein
MNIQVYPKSCELHPAGYHECCLEVDRELFRLRAVEKAAREAVEALERGVRLPFNHPGWERLLELRAALGEG